jgi:hypothetical protein
MEAMRVDKQCKRLVCYVAFSFRLFPRGYREEFGEEMCSVYFLAAEEAGRKGVRNLLLFLARELWGILKEASHDYWQLALERGGRQMDALAEGEEMARDGWSSLPGETRSWRTLLAGSLLFLVWGLEAIFSEAAFSDFGSGSAVLLAASQVCSWLVFLLPAVVAGYAWTHNFPRWTYAYIGSAFLYTYFMAANFIVTPQTSLLGNSPDAYTTWGWRAWIPLVLALGIGLSITRSLHPLVRFFTNAWLDWTLLSYALFGWIPLLLLASFDEMPSSLTLTFLPITTGILTIAAVLYLASWRISQRAVSLFAGVYLSLGLTLVVAELYWSGVGAFNSARILLILTVFLGVIFSPALIGVVRQFQRRSTLRQS